MIFGGVTTKNKSHPVYVIIGGNPDTKVSIQGHLSYNNRDVENGWVHHYKDRYGLNDFLVERTRKSEGKGTISIDDEGNTQGNPDSTSVRNYEMYNSFLFVDDAVKYGENNNKYNPVYTPIVYGYEYPSRKPSWAELCKPILINVSGGTSVIVTSSKDTQTLQCSGNNILYVYNLIPDLEYTYTVKNGNTTVRTGTFKTEGTIRLICMEGVRNMRDLGGYKTVDGTQRVKYGLLFRGGALQPTSNNTGSGGKYNITKRARQTSGLSGTTVDGGATENDVAEFKRLGITVDYDLRAYQSSLTTDNVGKSSSGAEFFNSTDGITYKNCPNGASASSYKTIYSKASEFEAFLDEIIALNGESALYFHCHQGRDRTGTYAAILFALLGIAEGHIIEDYEFTSLWGNATTHYMFLYLTSDETMIDGAEDNSGRMFNFAATSNINTYVTNKFSSLSGKINTLKTILLEPVNGSSVDHTPVDLFVSYNYRPSESASNLVYTTPSTWKFYEIQVTQGDTITITLDSPTNVVAVESTNGLSSRLANGTSNITSGWTNWDFHYHDVSSDYTVLNNGYLLLIIPTGRTATISLNSSSQSDVTPTVTCNFINSNSIPHSMTGDALTYIAPNEAVELGSNSERPNVAHKWTYGEIPVTSGDVVRVGLNTIDVFNWEAFVESTNGLLSSITNNTKVTFDSTQAHRVTSQATGKVWDTVSTGHYLYYGEHTVSSTGKLLIGIRIWNDGDPNTITPATYNGIIVKINGNSIPVTWYS